MKPTFTTQVKTVQGLRVTTTKNKHGHFWVNLRNGTWKCRDCPKVLSHDPWDRYNRGLSWDAERGQDW